MKSAVLSDYNSLRPLRFPCIADADISLKIFRLLRGGEGHSKGKETQRKSNRPLLELKFHNVPGGDLRDFSSFLSQTWNQGQI